MKNKIISRIVSIIILTILLVSMLPINVIKAETNGSFLISVGTGNYSITVTTSTTVNDIIKVLGQPKIKTPSAFGGYAYTFYTDSNYSNYLYIETTENDEKIISYGSVDSSFKARENDSVSTSTGKCNYGDTYNYTVNTYLSGIRINDDSKIKGAILYNREAFVDNDIMKVIELFENNYRSNPTYYLKGMAEQAVTMYNATRVSIGATRTNFIFDEQYFYMSEQLKENGTSIRNYIDNTNKYDYCNVIKRFDRQINSKYYLLNPMSWAYYATYDKAKAYKYNICIIDYDLNNEEGYIATISPKMFDEDEKKNAVQLTTDEQKKLSQAKFEYNKAMSYFAMDTNNEYVITPADTEASNLIAGQLKQSRKDGAISYINAIRLGAGMQSVSWSNEAYELAQPKATLQSYMCKKSGISALAHTFEKPVGVTDAFYELAFGGKYYVDTNNFYPYPGMKYSENASTVSYTSSVSKHIIDDVIGYIDDRKNASGGEADLGHRTTILNPKWSTLAMGVSDRAANIEFDDNRNTATVVGAWPSNGITLMETVYNPLFYWNAKFFDKYYVTSDTTVKVTCLNDNKVWNFNQSSSDKDHYYQVKPDSQFGSTIHNQVKWRDKDLVAKAGDVYEIEITNLENASTSKIETYKYRSVFKYADPSNDKSATKIINLSIQVPSTIERDSNGAYKIPDTDGAKLSITMNESAVDKAVKWTSSNPSLIEVTQNGILTVKKVSSTPVTITVCATSDNSISSQIKVVGYEASKLPKDYKIKLNYSEYQLNSLSESVTLKDSNIPSNKITWTSTNSKIAIVDSNGKVTPKAGGFVKINATSSEYGSCKCWVYVCVLRTLSDGRKAYPGDLDGNGVINSNDAAIALDWGNRNLTEDEVAVGDVTGDGIVNSIDAAVISDITNGTTPFKPGEYNPVTKVTLNKTSITLAKIGDTATINATFTPIDTTDSPNVKWSTSNAKVATVVDGKITAAGGGTATITAMVGRLSATCTVTVPQEQSTTPTKPTTPEIDYLLGDVDGNGKINAQDAVMILKYVAHNIDLTEQQLLAANTTKDADGTVDAQDAVQILKLVAHNISEF